MKFIMLLLCACCITAGISAQKHVRQAKRNIVGTWLSEDGEWKFVFTPQICKEYHGGSLSNLYQYRISADSIQCGGKVHDSGNDQDDYLQLTGLADGHKMCFLINSVGKKVLSLTDVLKYLPSIFIRQKD